MRGRLLPAAVLALTATLLPLAAPQPSSADGSSDAAHRVDQAASDLEESTATVRAAAAALAKVAVELPPARVAAAAAQARLLDAQAVVARSTATLTSAEQYYAASQAAVDDAGARLDAGRIAAGLIGRRSYQGGGLGPWRAFLGAQDVRAWMDRALSIRLVLRSQNAVLQQVSTDRAQLAATTALLAADAAGLAAAQQSAQLDADRAAAEAATARDALAKVAALLQVRLGALADAKANRAADLAAYAQAQAASRRLAAQLRALAEARRRLGHGGDSAVGRLLWPTAGPLTSRFGMRRHPIYGDYRFHAGIDIGAPIGQVVVAAASGTVVFAGAESGYGTLVLVDHGTVGGKGLATAYAHMSELLVHAGQTVRRGAPVGRVGSEGNSTGPHLHFEVRRDGDPVDPLGWVSPP